MTIGNKVVSLALWALGGSPVAAQTLRDSAGIRIVTYAEGARAKAVWHIAARPLLEIGGSNGTGPTEFTHIWAAARTPSGGVVVSDEPQQELRVFDATGRHLHTMGRKGRGPGEFSQIRAIAVYHDTVYALDDQQGTAAFTLDGKLIRQHLFPSLSPYHPVDPWGALADGSTIETAAGRETLQMLQQAGTTVEVRGLFRVAPDSRSATLLDTVRAFEFYHAQGDPAGRDLVAFAPMLTVAVFSDRVCTGRGERYEVRCMSPDGAPQMILRREVRPVPVNSAAREAYLAARRTQGRGENGTVIPQTRLDQLAAKTHFAEAFPLFGRIAAGNDDEIWVSDYHPEQYIRQPRDQDPVTTVRWNVFAKDGVWAGAVDLPARFILKDAGRDYVLGVNRDEDGVERVTVYQLHR